jgi:hypothetical protein
MPAMLARSDWDEAGLALPPAPPAPPPPPALPAMPPPPAPPKPPALPAIPAQAHLACAGKSVGSALTWVIKKGETMSGICKQGKNGMRFEPRSYHFEG